MNLKQEHFFDGILYTQVVIRQYVIIIPNLKSNIVYGMEW